MIHLLGENQKNIPEVSSPAQEWSIANPRKAIRAIFPIC
jgi:hypothetical protein